MSIQAPRQPVRANKFLSSFNVFPRVGRPTTAQAMVEEIPLINVDPNFGPYLITRL
jgi:hypothetical protein